MPKIKNRSSYLRMQRRIAAREEAARQNSRMVAPYVQILAEQESRSYAAAFQKINEHILVHRREEDLRTAVLKTQRLEKLAKLLALYGKDEVLCDPRPFFYARKNIFATTAPCNPLSAEELKIVEKVNKAQQQPENSLPEDLFPEPPELLPNDILASVRDLPAFQCLFTRVPTLTNPFPVISPSPNAEEVNNNERKKPVVVSIETLPKEKMVVVSSASKQ